MWEGIIERYDGYIGGGDYMPSPSRTVALGIESATSDMVDGICAMVISAGYTMVDCSVHDESLRLDFSPTWHPTVDDVRVELFYSGTPSVDGEVYADGLSFLLAIRRAFEVMK